ncbi:MAG TPA: 5'-3' exonuclease H3TH domain-containing protein [Candidatus Saccharimonadales bacterium]|nr:5'-3' exonuclease H3TH domain-containing protein [Candidatus Saccharimonadales bacterium]
MQLHLVDATYELFRAHFSPRPAVLGRDGRVLNGVSGLIETLLSLLSDEGATHVACATDRVIRSFRNDLFPGYKSEIGIAPELLSQFPIAERAIEALGLTLWPMVDYEADDALATAVARWVGDAAVDRIVICSVDKDLAQCVRNRRVVLRDRRRRITYDEEGVRQKWGVAPTSIPDLLALVGDSSDGYPGIPGWGAKTAAAVLARYGSIDEIPRRASDWSVTVRGAPVLAARLVAQAAEVQLYLELARLRTDADIPQRNLEELRWRGAPRATYQQLCDELGLDSLRDRPRRWLDD